MQLSNLGYKYRFYRYHLVCTYRQVSALLGVLKRDVFWHTLNLIIYLVLGALLGYALFLGGWVLLIVLLSWRNIFHMLTGG